MPMRPAALVALATLWALPTVAAVDAEHTIYLHENPLHALPESINANVGDMLTLTIENPALEGKGPHNLLVCGDGKKFTEACDDKWGFTAMIQPGETAALVVEAKRAGTFEYYCYIPGHKGAGMVGTLIVDGGDAKAKGIPLGPIAFLALAAAGAMAGRRSPR